MPTPFLESPQGPKPLTSSLEQEEGSDLRSQATKQCQLEGQAYFVG